jgi:hypothetical protein
VTPSFVKFNDELPLLIERVLPLPPADRAAAGMISFPKGSRAGTSMIRPHCRHGRRIYSPASLFP